MILTDCIVVSTTLGVVKEDVLSLNNNILLDLVSEVSSNKLCCVHDLGCGLGHFATRIKDRLASLPIEVLNVSGSDISTTAIEKASEIKGVDFYECDIQHEVLKQEYDIIVMSEVLWYLLENLETSFKNIWKSLSPHGTLIVKQYFPTTQNYGRDTINGVEGFYAFINRSLPWKKDVVIEITNPKLSGVVVLCSLTKC